MSTEPVLKKAKTQQGETKKTVAPGKPWYAKFQELKRESLCVDKAKDLWLCPTHEPDLPQTQVVLNMVYGVRNGPLMRRAGRCLWGFSSARCVEDTPCQKCVERVQRRNPDLALLETDDPAFQAVLETRSCLHSAMYSSCHHHQLRQAEHARQIPDSAVQLVKTTGPPRPGQPGQAELKRLVTFLTSQIAALPSHKQADRICLHSTTHVTERFLLGELLETDDDLIADSLSGDWFDILHDTVQSTAWLTKGLGIKIAGVRVADPLGKPGDTCSLEEAEDKEYLRTMQQLTDELLSARE